VDEGINDLASFVLRELGQVLLVEQEAQVDGGVAVVNGGGELQNPHHAATSAVFFTNGGVFLLAIVDGCVEV
jgi:hypothetical protein